MAIENPNVARVFKDAIKKHAKDAKSFSRTAKKKLIGAITAAYPNIETQLEGYLSGEAVIPSTDLAITLAKFADIPPRVMLDAMTDDVLHQRGDKSKREAVTTKEVRVTPAPAKTTSEPRRAHSPSLRTPSTQRSGTL
jgi:hypothetical protein